MWAKWACGRSQQPQYFPAPTSENHILAKVGMWAEHHPVAPTFSRLPTCFLGYVGGAKQGMASPRPHAHMILNMAKTGERYFPHPVHLEG